ncbi:hypothetical protein ACIQU5_27705 [Streptomyces sp. NPDC090306]|uniref:hypothetical protein n=1 Tax=Streptomyces sp. NPDC090306 TaxID=3365961 RepID=UPI0037F34EBA
MTDTTPIPAAPAAAGAVELPADAYPAGSRYANDDLRPVPLAERRWTTYNFVALCVAQERTHTSWYSSVARFAG